MEPATEERKTWGGTDTKQDHEDGAGKLMNLFRPVPNASEKQQFCQIVKILVCNKCRKRWHMCKKKSQNNKKQSKNTKKTPKTAGNRGKNGGKTRKKTKKQRFFSSDHVTGHLLAQTWATDRLLCAPPCVYTALCVYRLACGPLNNLTPAVATDRLLCAPPCVCTALPVAPQITRLLRRL